MRAKYIINILKKIVKKLQNLPLKNLIAYQKMTDS